MTDTTPIAANRTLPRRLPNAAYRQREYLTEREVDRLIDAARRRGRNGARDTAAILLAYRHGLRAAELCSLRWSQIDLRHGRLHVNRAKGGIESVHHAWPRATGAKAIAMQEPVRVCHRGRYACNNCLVPANGSTNGQSGQAPLPCSSAHAETFDRLQARQRWPRHEITGALSGHRNLQSTARYTALAPDRFAKFWRD